MKALIMAGWQHVPHLDEQTKQELLSAYPESERAARMNGEPVLGSGKVFPFTESYIKVDPFPIPDYWYRICGIDFGWDHPGAGAWLAEDRDTGTIYLYDCYQARQQPAVVHASHINRRGDWIPVAWPHDGHAHDKGNGKALAEQYAEHGVNMLPEHAHIELDDGKRSNSLEASIGHMIDDMLAGQFKVFSTCEDWWREFRTYHRKDGKIVQLVDDVISSSRYAHMMMGHAKRPPRSERRDKGERRQRSWITA